MPHHGSRPQGRRFLSSGDKRFGHIPAIEFGLDATDHVVSDK